MPGSLPDTPLTSDDMQHLHRLSLQRFFQPCDPDDNAEGTQGRDFCRRRFTLPGVASVVQDSFEEPGDIHCCFIRLETSEVQLVADGTDRIQDCAAGGWLLSSSETGKRFYWIPQPPVARKLDDRQRILAEHETRIHDLEVSPQGLAAGIDGPSGMKIDLVVWRFGPTRQALGDELKLRAMVESWPLALWNSQTRYGAPADLFLYLVHGHVYVDRFIWPRMWKICSELDAYGLYCVMAGLETSTDKIIYGLLKRQLLYSVIDRQAEDGGWYHGEWTDLMESHYRFHNGAMLLLQAALLEHPDPVVKRALEKAAQFISAHTDHIDSGLWFLHDSLEEDAQMMRELCRQTGSTWIPAKTLGKSTTNKLILNTHLDSIVVLARYREITGDDRYTADVDSARAASRDILARRPAEFLYRLAYRAINLTLLPEPRAMALPLPVRAVKRLTWKYFIPQMYRLKNAFPRLVMPGGFIERHLAMPHFDINYHPVNLLDLVRLWRCFPQEDLGEIIDNAVGAVTQSSILDYWAEAGQRHFSLVVWTEALYQLTTLKSDLHYRRLLAEAMLKLSDLGLGLPPSLLGSDFEAVPLDKRRACPSPRDPGLRLASIPCNGEAELLLVNTGQSTSEPGWENGTGVEVKWQTLPDGVSGVEDSELRLPPRSWALGARQ